MKIEIFRLSKRIMLNKSQNWSEEVNKMSGGANAIFFVVVRWSFMVEMNRKVQRLSTTMVDDPANLLVNANCEP